MSSQRKQREALPFPLFVNVYEVNTEYRIYLSQIMLYLADYFVVLHKTLMCNDEIKPDKNSIGRERLISKMAF